MYGQKKYPQNYFRKPLEIPIILAGTFGELRNNHFHSGVDIKTQQKTGFKVFAAAAGYISRIKISLWGYGKALYITHPNGYTTVYAHLKKYGPGIEEFVKKIQYKKEHYQTGNIYLKSNKFPVKKGQIVAYSGATGGFVAPHLHYEFRDTKTEHIINPMLFGLIPKDTKCPIIKKLILYPLNKDARINQSNKKNIISIKNIKKGEYKSNRITASGLIGFGINVFDKLDEATNRNGIYSLEMQVNGKRMYYHDVETFSFPESKYINLFIDYPYFATYKSKIQKTFKVAKNKLHFYKGLINNGNVNIKNGLNYTVKIIAKDFKGNSSILKIPIIGKDNNTLFSTVKDTTAYKIISHQFQKFTKENVTIAFPKNTFYEDIYLDFDVVNGIVKIHKPIIPLNKKFTLTFYTNQYSDSKKKHLYIANINNKKYPRYQKTIKKKDKFYTRTKTLGNYTLLHDNQNPKIILLSFKNKQWISNNQYLKVKIYDNESGIKNYRATIDGKWVLMEYNLKKKLLTYNFNDKKLIGSKHHFKIMVSDNVGNTKILSATFYRKKK